VIKYKYLFKNLIDNTEYLYSLITVLFVKMFIFFRIILIA